jgi:hypothetical protein
VAQLLRVSILGIAPGGEEWSVNPVFRISGAGDIISSAEGAQIVTGINGVTVPTGLRALMASSSSVSGVRVEARFLNGNLEGVFEGLRGSAVPGTGAAPHPPQCAMVFSLRTQTPGPSGRGRMYWPATGVAMSSSTLRGDSAVVGAALTAFKTYMAAIETAIETVLAVPVSLDVWSRKNASSATVDRLQIGDVVDTQRRRRDTLPEAYQEVSYP